MLFAFTFSYLIYFQNIITLRENVHLTEYNDGRKLQHQVSYKIYTSRAEI